MNRYRIVERQVNLNLEKMFIFKIWSVVYESYFFSLSKQLRKKLFHQAYFVVYAPQIEKKYK